MSVSPLHRFVLPVAATLVSLALPSGAHGAAPPVSVAVERATGTPSTYFSERATPGSAKHVGSLLIENTTSHAITVQLRRVNALTTDTLGSAYGATGARPHGSTSWTALPSAALRLAPGERQRVPVEVRVPAAAAPGDYLTGISVFAPGQGNQTAARGGLQIGQEYRYAVGVETRIPGARTPRITFTSARLVRQPATAVTLVRARNSGNVTLKHVHGSVLVTQGDRVVARQRIGPGTFVAGTGIAFPVRFNGERPRAGAAYRVRARMVYGSRVATFDTRVRFSTSAAKVQEQYAPATPATGTSRNATARLLVVAGIILAALLLLWRWRRLHVPGPAGTRRILDRELAALGESGRPLSVVRVQPVAARREARRVARALRPLLPPADRIGRLDDTCLLIVLPRTGGALVAALEGEIQDTLDARGSSCTVASATVTTTVDRDALLARLEPPAIHDVDGPPAFRDAA